MNQGHAQGDVIYMLIISTLLGISQLAMRSDGRYLRPADHGLTYQNSTTPTRDNVLQQQQQQMISFFNGGKPASSFQSELPLPEAKNLTTSGDENVDWWNRRVRSRDNGSRNHLKEILLVASLACGLAGIVFLAVSGFIFLSRHREQHTLPEATATLALTGGAVCGPNKV